MTPVTDLVIKSYPGDYEWLGYCLRSIQKFCTGFNNVIVMLPRSHPLPLTKETVVLLDAPEGYLQQQVAKLNADRHTQADYVVHIDSDTIFTRPITPEFFFRNGKPVWTVTPFDESDPDEKKAWLHVMVKCLRKMPPYEFMRKCVIPVPRFIYALFREFIEKTHKMTMEQYICSQPGHEFSEYNCLGFFCWLYHRDQFHWNDTSIDGVTNWPWLQKWSWGGLTPEIRNEFERILE
jgi:hypothetical protein